MTARNKAMTKGTPAGVVSSKKPRGRRYLQAWLPSELYGRLETQAARNQRTIGAEVRYTLGVCLDPLGRPRRIR
jgi:hypothetical protein